jgi:hypothetical protein
VTVTCSVRRDRFGRRSGKRGWWTATIHSSGESASACDAGELNLHRLSCSRLGAQSTARLFVSSTTKVLKSYWIAAAEKLQQLRREVVVEETFLMVHEKTDHDAGRQNCPCDAVILLIGLVVGCQPADWPPKLPLRSYRQFGYDITAELPKAVFRFLAVKDTKLDSGEPATDPQQAPQYPPAN